MTGLPDDHLVRHSEGNSQNRQTTVFDVPASELMIDYVMTSCTICSGGNGGYGSSGGGYGGGGSGGGGYGGGSSGGGSSYGGSGGGYGGSGGGYSGGGG